MGNSIKPHIESAEKSGACNLSKQGLNEFPEALFKVKNLRTLDLSDNKLHVLPGGIGGFSVMKHLTINRNRLENLPPEVGKLEKIEHLSLQSNRLLCLPTTAAQLSALRDINLSHNFLSSIPLQLAGLKHLNSLDLSHNKITLIPEEIKGLEAIEINLNQNQITRISEKIAECQRLKVLRLEENCLELAAIKPAMLKNSGISLLTLEGNLFEMKAFHQLDGYEEWFGSHRRVISMQAVQQQRAIETQLYFISTATIPQNFSNESEPVTTVGVALLYYHNHGTPNRMDKPGSHGSNGSYYTVIKHSKKTT